jgi:hypothetical protein
MPTMVKQKFCKVPNVLILLNYQVSHIIKAHFITKRRTSF